MSMFFCLHGTNMAFQAPSGPMVSMILWIFSQSGPFKIDWHGLQIYPWIFLLWRGMGCLDIYTLRDNCSAVLAFTVLKLINNLLRGRRWWDSPIARKLFHLSAFQSYINPWNSQQTQERSNQSLLVSGIFMASFPQVTIVHDCWWDQSIIGI